MGGPNNPGQRAPPVIQGQAAPTQPPAWVPEGTFGVPAPYTTAESQYNGAFAFTPDGLTLYVANAHIYQYTVTAGVCVLHRTAGLQDAEL
jgi:hypothetical protein